MPIARYVAESAVMLTYSPRVLEQNSLSNRKVATHAELVSVSLSSLSEFSRGLSCNFFEDVAKVVAVGKSAGGCNLRYGKFAF